MAAGLLNGLFAAGKSVPEDFEIITSNDSPVTSYTRPNLSSINHPLYDLGAVSMRMLTKIMHKEELEDKDVILNHGLTYASQQNKKELGHKFVSTSLF